MSETETSSKIADTTTPPVPTKEAKASHDESTSRSSSPTAADESEAHKSEAHGHFFERNIFVFCDGTWCGKATDTTTNVKLIYDFVKKTCQADRAKYFDGLGLGDRLGNLPISASTRAS